jgi:hypothetical protein
MNAAHWIAFAALAAIAVVATFYLYRRREPAGRGRNALATLRACALILLILLILDPRVRQPVKAEGGNHAPILLDASLSMMMPSRDGTTQWSDAVRQATQRANGATITTFGSTLANVNADSAARLQPAATHSLLLPALQSASESGAEALTIVTDGDIEDADAVARWIPRLGMSIDWVHPAAAANDLALTEISAPSWGESNKPINIDVGVQSVGGNGSSNGSSNSSSNAADSVSVTLRQDAQIVATKRIARPASARTSTASIAITPHAPPGGGYVRIEATIDDPSFKDDNTRNVYVYVSDEPAGIVLVSLAPDWEPRFLLPVLEKAVALPARGYLKGANGSWMRVGTGLDAGARVTDDVVQKAVHNADLVVVHNASRNEPTWVSDAIRNAPRLIVLPSNDASGIPTPSPLSAASPGDWFASADIPPSPVAQLMNGLKVEDMPPLEAVIPVSLPAGAWAPLAITRGRRGEPYPIAMAGEQNGKRWAVGLASGYWRWAFQGGASGDVYNRLWSSLGGWIMRDARAADIGAIRPVDRAIMRGAAIRWVTRAGALDSIRVTLKQQGGQHTITRKMIAVHDTAVMPDVAYGTYHYDATAFANNTTTTASGELTVETYTPEFARHSATLLNSKATATALRAHGRETKPLHASWLPYVLLLLLLSTEWILRRRWGLR